MGFDVSADAKLGDGDDFIPIEFGPATKLVTVSAPGAYDDDLTLTGDMLEIYFVSNRGPGGDEIYVATRTAVTLPFGSPQLVTALDSTSFEQTAELMPDGLTMYLASGRDGSVGGYDLFVTTRPTRTTTWSTPSRIVELSTSYEDVAATPRSDLEMMFTSNRDGSTGDHDLYRASRSSTTQPWVVSERLAELDDGGSELTPFPIGTNAFMFSSSRSGNKDLYLVTGPPFVITPITSINTPAGEEDPWLAPDRSRLFFASDREGTWDLYEAAAL